MYKFVPSTWTTPALCIFDEHTLLVKYCTTTDVCFLGKNGTHFKLKVPNPRAIRLTAVTTTNNIYLHIGDYYTIVFRRRSKTFDLIGQTANQ